MADKPVTRPRGAPLRPTRYVPPSDVSKTTLQAALDAIGLPRAAPKQMSLLSAGDAEAVDIPLWYAGDLDVLKRPAVAVVGARAVTDDGARRARRVAKELAQAGITVVSGLAAGVDTHALTSAIEAGGSVAAVIGTPLSKATPAENSELQTLIYSKHVLFSQFREGETIHKANFPKRNRTMALLTRGTLIVEASDTSGTLHQAAECARQRRWLFVLRSVIETPNVTWPERFKATYDQFVVVESIADVLRRVESECSS